MDAGPTDRDIHSGMPDMEGMARPGLALGAAKWGCMKSERSAGWEGGTAAAGAGAPGCAHGEPAAGPAGKLGRP